MLSEEMLYDEAFAEKVKKVFWRDGLIVMMPSQLKKRKVLLDLLALDFEHDSLDTPRIVAVAHRADPVGVLGIVRRDALLVREFKLEPGQGYFVSTYERNCPCDRNREPAFNATTAEAAAQFVIDGGVFAEFTNPVTACAAVADGKGFALAFKTV